MKPPLPRDDDPTLDDDLGMAAPAEPLGDQRALRAEMESKIDEEIVERAKVARQRMFSAPVVPAPARQLVRSYWVNKQAMRVHAEVPDGMAIESAFYAELLTMAEQKFGAGHLRLISDRRYEWVKS